MPKGDLASALPYLKTHLKFEALVRMVRGLSWVHGKLGVIHRDLKPANVLLDQADLAYVADWGLARPVGHAVASVRSSQNDSGFERPDRTKAGSFVGTVTYAAPEQILGAQDLDHRADIYALGCIMFECETGSPPFAGRTVADIARQHIRTPPPTVGGWFKKTELGLETVIARCLQKKPADRYSYYSELDEVLADVARKRGFPLDRCTIAVRYERSQLGKGHLRQDAILERPQTVRARGYQVVEFEDIAPFLEEAEHLISLNRYQEAEQLLRPYFLPDSCMKRTFGGLHIRWHSLMRIACYLLGVSKTRSQFSRGSTSTRTNRLSFTAIIRPLCLKLESGKLQIRFANTD